MIVGKDVVVWARQFDATVAGATRQGDWYRSVSGLGFRQTGGPRGTSRAGDARRRRDNSWTEAESTRPGHGQGFPNPRLACCRIMVQSNDGGQAPGGDRGGAGHPPARDESPCLIAHLGSPPMTTRAVSRVPSSILVREEMALRGGRNRTGSPGQSGGPRLIGTDDPKGLLSTSWSFTATACRRGSLGGPGSTTSSSEDSTPGSIRISRSPRRVDASPPIC
jgi:hypothetical protein